MSQTPPEPPAPTPPAPTPPAPPAPPTPPAPPAPPAPPQTEEFDYPKDKPLAEMTEAQRSEYWRDRAQKHESRNKDLLRITGGKYGDELKAELDAAAKLRQDQMTDAQRAVEEAKQQTRAETAKELGAAGARVALEFALGHDPEKNDQSSVIEALDLTKLLNDDGQVDTAKVRALAATIAPAGKGTGGRPDFGAGNRGTTPGGTGVAAGRALYESSRRKTTSTT